MNIIRRHFSIVLLMTLLFISAGSYAGPYIGLSIGESAADEKCEDIPYPYYLGTCEGIDDAGKIFAGIRYNENVAFEVAYLDMGELVKTINETRITAEPTGTNFSIVGIYPTEIFVEFYGKAGLLLWDTTVIRHEPGGSSVDDDGTDLSFGIGLSIRAEKYAIRIEYEELNEINGEYSPGGTTLTFISFGGDYYF